MENYLDDNYTTAVETIKTAILQGQYEAAKGINRIQLAVYFGIGKYISLNTRKKHWGKGALKIISERLQRELPGLRGYAETQLREMRLFYEEWIMLDANSSVATDELQIVENKIDIFNFIKIPSRKSAKRPSRHRTTEKTVECRGGLICKSLLIRILVNALHCPAARVVEVLERGVPGEGFGGAASNARYARYAHRRRIAREKF